MFLFTRTLIAVAAGAVLSGQTPMARIIVFGEATTFRRNAWVFVQEAGKVFRADDRPGDQRSWGIRTSMGIDIDSPWSLELSIHSKNSSPFTYAGNISPNTSVDLRNFRLEYSWWGPGLSCAFNIGSAVRFNLGMDFRIERLTVFMPKASPSDEEGYSETTVYPRPWARASLILDLPSYGTVRPFLGAEFAAALIRKHNQDWSPTQPLDPEDLRRGFAPDTSMAVFVGLAF